MRAFSISEQYPMEYEDWHEARDMGETSLGFLAWMRINHPDKIGGE